MNGEQLIEELGQALQKAFILGAYTPMNLPKRIVINPEVREAMESHVRATTTAAGPFIAFMGLPLENDSSVAKWVIKVESKETERMRELVRMDLEKPACKWSDEDKADFFALWGKPQPMCRCYDCNMEAMMAEIVRKRGPWPEEPVPEPNVALPCTCVYGHGCEKQQRGQIGGSLQRYCVKERMTGHDTN